MDDPRMEAAAWLCAALVFSGAAALVVLVASSWALVSAAAWLAIALCSALPIGAALENGDHRDSDGEDGA